MAIPRLHARFMLLPLHSPSCNGPNFNQIRLRPSETKRANGQTDKQDLTSASSRLYRRVDSSVDANISQKKNLLLHG
jgi:hypothetical protein